METKYDYEGLLTAFLNNLISPTDFAITYMDRLKEEWDDINKPIYEILIFMFYECNDFSDNPKLIDRFPDRYINEDRLRTSASDTLQKLQTLK